MSVSQGDKYKSASGRKPT